MTEGKIVCSTKVQLDKLDNSWFLVINFSQSSAAVGCDSGNQNSLKQYLLPLYLASVKPFGHPVNNILENVEESVNKVIKVFV